MKGMSGADDSHCKSHDLEANRPVLGAAGCVRKAASAY